MAFILTFLLVAGLEATFVHSDNEIVEPTPDELIKEPDLCVGCDEKKKKDLPEPDPVEIEIIIDPVTGKVQYVIKGLEIK